MAGQRPTVIRGEIWKPNTGQDPARYLVNPGAVTKPGKHSAGQLRHARPYIASGQNFFVFPIGVEGFRRTGQASVGIHRYIGDNAVAANTIHREEARIELSGLFPGITSQNNMVDCISILVSDYPDPGLVLYAPGVFEREQFVIPESWDFTHEPDDRTHSIAYTITFIRIGTGLKVSDPKGAVPPPNPTSKTKPKGKPERIFTVSDGVRTLRGIAKAVYNNQDQWQKLVQLNQGLLNKWKKSHPVIPTHQLPTYRWPIGTKFRY